MIYFGGRSQSRWVGWHREKDHYSCLRKPTLAQRQEAGQEMRMDGRFPSCRPSCPLIRGVTSFERSSFAKTISWRAGLTTHDMQILSAPHKNCRFKNRKHTELMNITDHCHLNRKKYPITALVGMSNWSNYTLFTQIAPQIFNTRGMVSIFVFYPKLRTFDLLF